MRGRIFLRDPAGRLRPLDEAPYDSEDLLQDYLGTNPDLLAGYQMDEAAPRRWLFVRRELGVEDASGSSRWAVDHVFIDQDAIPTLVEVKRSSDTRIRREVVGQLLEYGANAVSHWPAGALRAAFEARCEAQGLDALEELRGSLGGTIEDDDFWNRVEENLRAGHIRLLIAADRIAPELHRIVEFLNEQMSPAEVLALEVRQFLGDGGQILVPRILGSTMSARGRKAPPKGRETPWTPEEFLERLENTGHHREAATAQRLIEWARTQRLRVAGGSGSKAATLYLSTETADRESTPFCLYEGHGSGGLLQIQIDELGPVLARETAALKELCEQFAKIPSVVIDPARKYPGIKLSLLSERNDLLAATAAMERAVAAIRAGMWS